ncbi:MAG: hypothetical protein WC755_05065 [Candidatus Woesearchaeota archaeon]|jgi:hypothetical protein
MKKILSIFFLLLVSITLVFAAGSTQGGSSATGSTDEQVAKEVVSSKPIDTNKPEETGSVNVSGQDNKQEVMTTQETQNKGEESQLQVQNRVQTKAQNSEELKQMMQNKQQEMAQESSSEKNPKIKSVMQNQNQVRLAVHSLLAMENVVGGIGPQVSEIAKHFNNSVQSTIKAEEKIQTRSAVSRFFAGGDKKAAEDMEKEVNQNMQKLQELKQLKENCNCDEQVKQTMQEQIQNMEKEQTRLKELADKEKKSKGILGWMWK